MWYCHIQLVGLRYMRLLHSKLGGVESVPFAAGTFLTLTDINHD